MQNSQRTVGWGREPVLNSHDPAGKREREKWETPWTLGGISTHSAEQETLSETGQI